MPRPQDVQIALDLRFTLRDDDDDDQKTKQKIQALLADSSRSGLYLSSPTKGDMELTTGTTWTLTERDLPDFDWLPSMDAITSDTEM